MHKNNEIKQAIINLCEDQTNQKYQDLVDLHKRFLVIFTRRLCEFEPEVVERWMVYDFIPLQECLETCSLMRNYMGEALLTQRFGDGRKAIKIYIEAMQ